MGDKIVIPSGQQLTVPSGQLGQIPVVAPPLNDGLVTTGDFGSGDFSGNYTSSGLDYYVDTGIDFVITAGGTREIYVHDSDTLFDPGFRMIVFDLGAGGNWVIGLASFDGTEWDFNSEFDYNIGTELIPPNKAFDGGGYVTSGF